MDRIISTQIQLPGQLIAFDDGRFRYWQADMVRPLRSKILQDLPGMLAVKDTDTSSLSEAPLD